MNEKTEASNTEKDKHNTEETPKEEKKHPECQQWLQTRQILEKIKSGSRSEAAPHNNVAIEQGGDRVPDHDGKY